MVGKLNGAEISYKEYGFEMREDVKRDTIIVRSYGDPRTIREAGSTAGKKIIFNVLWQVKKLFHTYRVKDPAFHYSHQ